MRRTQPPAIHDPALFALLMNLIQMPDRRFWYNDNKGGGQIIPRDDIPDLPLPLGIQILQKIVATFKKQYKDLPTNISALNEMLVTCQSAMTKAVIQEDAQYKNACQFYKVLANPTMDDLKELATLHAMLLDYMFFKSIYLKSEKIPSLPAHAKRFKHFVEHDLQHWFNDRPHVLLALDYIVDQTSKTPLGKHQTAYDAYQALETYVNEVLCNNTFWFLKSFGTPEKLATCLRTDTYVACLYTKETREFLPGDREKFLRDDINYVIQRITRHIIEQALSEKYFNRIFHDADDVLTLIRVLTQNMLEFGYALGYPIEGLDQAYIGSLANTISRHPDFLQKLAEQLADQPEKLTLLCEAMPNQAEPLKRALIPHIVNTPDIIKKLADNPQTRNSFYTAIPGLEERVKAKVLQNVGFGLMFSRQKGRADGQLIGNAPIDVLKIIARESANAMGAPSNPPKEPDDPLNKGMKKK